MSINFDSLSLQIRIKICSYLTTTELQQHFAPVCCTWKSFASEILREEITFDDDTHSTKDVIEAVQKTYNLRVITFTRSTSAFTKSFNESFNWYVISRALPRFNLKNLRKFEFISCKLSSNAVKKLVARFPEIEEVKIVFRKHDDFTLKYSIIRQMVKWKILKNISVDMALSSSRLCDDYGHSGSKITGLIFTKCKNLTQFEMLNQLICRRAFKQLTRLRGPDLETLNVMVCHKYCEEDTPVTLALERCPNLKVLHLYKEDPTITVKTNKLLEELYLTDCMCVDSLFSYVVFTHLYKLTITGDKYYGSTYPWKSKRFFAGCPMLMCLELKDVMLEDHEVACIVNYCKKLKRLSFDSVLPITTKSLVIITMFLPNVEYVKYKMCTHFNPDCTYLLETRLRYPRLKIVVCCSWSPCTPNKCCQY